MMNLYSRLKRDFSVASAVKSITRRAHYRSSFPLLLTQPFPKEIRWCRWLWTSPRHILYTRSEKGMIQVYDLGNNSQSMTRVAAVNTNTIVQSAANIARYGVLKLLLNEFPPLN